MRRVWEIVCKISLSGCLCSAPGVHSCELIYSRLLNLHWAVSFCTVFTDGDMMFFSEPQSSLHSDIYDLVAYSLHFVIICFYCLFFLTDQFVRPGSSTAIWLICIESGGWCSFFFHSSIAVVWYIFPESQNGFYRWVVAVRFRLFQLMCFSRSTYCIFLAIRVPKLSPVYLRISLFFFFLFYPHCFVSDVYD